MKPFLSSPFGRLVLTGTIASFALLIESRLQVPEETHFLMQFVWLGVVAAALMSFALLPALKMPARGDAQIGEIDADPPPVVIPEFLDEDRQWLQMHPNSTWNEQV